MHAADRPTVVSEQQRLDPANTKVAAVGQPWQLERMRIVVSSVARDAALTAYDDVHSELVSLRWLRPLVLPSSAGRPAN